MKLATFNGWILEATRWADNSGKFVAWVSIADAGKPTGALIHGVSNGTQVGYGVGDSRRNAARAALENARMRHTGYVADNDHDHISALEHAMFGLPYVISIVVDDEVVSTAYCYQPMRRTLGYAAGLLRGVPQAEACIRKGGNMVAWLHTNFRGELDEAEIHAGRWGWKNTTTVTPLNPNGPIFRGVFAK